MPGLFADYVEVRSVLRNQRATPVEAVDQRGADRLHKWLERDCCAGESSETGGRSERLCKRGAVIESRTVFGLHEPARCRDSENVEIVLDAAANEPPVTVEGRCGGVGGNGRGQECLSSARPLRTGVTTIDVGQHIGRNQIPDSRASNTTSPHWRGWLKPENRCLVPANSFAEYAPEPNPETKKKDVVWFALNDDRPLFAFGGIWTEFRGDRGTKSKPIPGPHLVYGFLTTAPNAIVEPIHPKPCR
jgi:putative SOS response-associated peptidase YedK